MVNIISSYKAKSRHQQKWAKEVRNCTKNYFPRISKNLLLVCDQLQQVLILNLWQKLICFFLNNFFQILQKNSKQWIIYLLKIFNGRDFSERMEITGSQKLPLFMGFNCDKFWNTVCILLKFYFEIIISTIHVILANK